MKQGKSPMKAQKLRLKSLGLNPENWFITKDSPTCFQVIYRHSDKTRKWELRKQDEEFRWVEIHVKKASAPTETVEKIKQLHSIIDVSKVESLMDPTYLNQVLGNEA